MFNFFRGDIMEKRKGFTLIELLVVIAIIAVLMAILMPALQRVKEQAREMTCRANLRQYGIVQHMYLDDHDERYPYSWTSLVSNERPVGGYERHCRWHDPRYPPDGPLWPYMPEEKVNLCPSFKVSRMTGAGFGGCTVTLIEEKAIPAYQARLETYERIFSFKPESFVCYPADGAKIVLER